MPTVLSEEEVERSALSAFIRFHRQSANGSIRIVKVPVEEATPEVGLEMDSFTEEDVKCRRTNGGWACTIQHLHLSKTQKGMPYVFEYEVEDDLRKATFRCKPASQTIRSLMM